MTLEETLDRYDQAWNEDDEETCRAHLKRCLTDDGVYCDPTVEVVGADALAANIGVTRRAFGGFRIKEDVGLRATSRLRAFRVADDVKRR